MAIQTKATPAPRATKRAGAASRITRRPATKRSAVNQHQARHLSQLIRLLERQALAHFRVKSPARLPTGRHKEFFRLEAYPLFLEGAYACGFVCGDLKPDNPLEGERARPAEAIAGWSFQRLRRYVHYLLRHERWADGYSSPILEALAAGHLQQVGQRLDLDQSLYEPA
jgi:hypothetical protein